MALGQGRGKEGILFCPGHNVKTYGLFCLNEEVKVDCIGGVAPFTVSFIECRTPSPWKQISVLQMGAHLLSVADSALNCTWGARCLFPPSGCLVSHCTWLSHREKTPCSQRSKINFSLKAWTSEKEIKKYVGQSNPLKMKWLILSAENELSYPISRQEKREREWNFLWALVLNGLCAADCRSIFLTQAPKPSILNNCLNYAMSKGKPLFNSSTKRKAWWKPTEPGKIWRRN